MTLLYILIFWTSFELLLFLSTRYYSRGFPWLLTKQSVFPQINEEQLDRFLEHGFDSELGWVRKPNTSKKEEVKTVGEIKSSSPMSSYSISSKGERKNPAHEGYPIETVVYGDSYAFCRHVDDHQTWQWYLSEKTKTNVVNLGVGNYGMDQAIRRFELEVDQWKPKQVILMVVPETLSRMLNTWKHYLEYGNLLGFKGQYRLNDQSEIYWESSPMKKKEDFLNYKKHLDKIHEIDVAYQKKFLKDLLHFPYSFSLLKNFNRNTHILGGLMLRSLLGWTKQPWILNYAWNVVLDFNFKYSESLYKNKNHQNVMMECLKHFKNICEQKSITPFFVMVPYLHELKSESFHCSSTLDEVRKTLPVIDVWEKMKKHEDIDSLYVSTFSAAHLSPAGNQVLSEIIYDYLSGKK